MGLPRETIRRLLKGAFLHDAGKIGIPDSTLLEPGRLTEAERRTMDSHVDLGLDILGQSAWLADAAEVMGGHHEKCVGSGYPKGIDESRIPVTAKVFAVAEVFDALTARRPCKAAFNFEEAMSRIRAGRGSHFDPEVFDAFEAAAPVLYRTFLGRTDEGSGRSSRPSAEATSGRRGTTGSCVFDAAWPRGCFPIIPTV
jgi:HD-GYP domain-containing protein (c-di-GMP phosphodiesterase class II)